MINNKTILIIIVIAIAILAFTKYTNVNFLSRSPDDRYRFPKQYTFGTVEEDLLNTGLAYDNNLPEYYMLNGGAYPEGDISNDQIPELIRESENKKLFEQHNFNIDTSPHTHIGKNRGYISWEPTI